MLEDVLAVVEELAGRRVERDHHVHAGRVAGLLDRVDQEVERGPVRLEVRREAALVPPPVESPFLLRIPLSAW